MERKRSVMVVDDNVDISQMVKMVLEKAGLYRVDVCNNAREAFNAVLEVRPDLVLLDIRMPGGDGTDIAQKIWEEKALSRTKVVFMTSLVSKDELPENSIIGGHPFISKPIRTEELLKRVNGFFEIGTCRIKDI